jgi:tetratricopeptide (TPR) repeat protein
MRRVMDLLGYARWLAVVVALALPASALAQQADRDLEARKHFAVGEYKEALEIYGALYAQTLHPTYLRNIGRCYQNMGEPDKAISSFREYLRKAKTLDAKQREEIEGFIKEMEALKRSREAAAEPPAANRPSPPEASKVAPAPAPNLEAPHAESAAEPPPGATLTPGAGEPPSGTNAEEDRAFYGRWWFWTIVGAVAVGGVTTAVLLSRPAATPSEMTALGTKRPSSP